MFWADWPWYVDVVVGVASLMGAALALLLLAIAVLGPTGTLFRAMTEREMMRRCVEGGPRHWNCGWTWCYAQMRPSDAPLVFVAALLCVLIAWAFVVGIGFTLFFFGGWSAVVVSLPFIIAIFIVFRMDGGL